MGGVKKRKGKLKDWRDRFDPLVTGQGYDGLLGIWRTAWGTFTTEQVRGWIGDDELKRLGTGEPGSSDAIVKAFNAAYKAEVAKAPYCYERMRELDRRFLPPATGRGV